MKRQDRRDAPAAAAQTTGKAGAAPDGRAAGIERLALHLLVLFCGVGLMSLEMVGARVLWNNFGSSVFVWGSIISVFMAALALGYYAGGMLADRRPTLTWLAGIVGAAGAATLVISHWGLAISRAVDGWNLGPRAGPLAAAAVLYFVPSVLLGAVSPFAVRLSARQLASMGNVAGRLYALSTVGSLVGTLLTTFLLIPVMGTTKILYSIGALLMTACILALAAAFAARGGPRTTAGATATALLLAAALGLGYLLNPLGLPGALQPQSGVVLDSGASSGQHYFLLDGREHESAYHNIAIVGRFDRTRYGHLKDSEGRPVLDAQGLTQVSPRQGLAEDPDAVLEMRFNNLIESSIFPNKEGQPPETTYTRALHLGMAFNPQCRRVLVVGLGGGSVPREFVEIYSDRDLSVDVVEVDARVDELARQHFLHADSEDPAHGVRTFIDDGRQFVRRGGGRHQQYDLIILDAYSGGGQVPAHLVTLEFLQQVRARLAEGGVLVSNIIGSLEGPKSRFFLSEHRTMQQIFPEIYVFPTSVGHPELVRNLILVAPLKSERRLPGQDIVAAARELIERYPALKDRPVKQSSSVADLTGFAAQLHHFTPAAERELAALPVLTDEYAPVETMFYWVNRSGR
jgi:spermidine synthase